MTPVVKLIAIPVAIVAALCLGLFLGGNPKYLPDDVRDVFVENDRALRAEIIDKLDDGYYKPIDEDKLEQASLKGMIRELHDPFSHYLTPKEADLYNKAFSGNFEGVGLTVRGVKRGLVVASVFDGSPAQKAGIHRDDVITAVDGKSIAGEPTDVSTAKIKGPPGTAVRLTILPGGSARKKRAVEVKRARIKIPYVAARLIRRGGKKVAYVRLFQFTDGVHGELREKLDKLLRQGAQGVLLDLRGNGGGLLREGVLVASIFVDHGLVVSTKGLHRPEEKYETEGSPIGTGLPMVVLVDGSTASASEIVTGALRDKKRATVVGERTFGKGVVQELEPLSNGGALDITVSSYYLPDGENISHKGIAPQVKARDLPRTKTDEALPRAVDVLVAKT